MDGLKDKYQKYLILLSATQDEYGFIEHHECDSLLFTSLVGCLPDFNPDINAAFSKETQTWHRRSVDKPCYPDHSKSTISRDMLLGLAWYCWHKKRADIAEHIIKYALANKGMMGEANDFFNKIGRCFIGPGLLSTFAHILYKLGGKNYWWLRWIPPDYGSNLSGYQAHLQVLHVLLREKVTGKINRYDKNKLIYHANRQPNNPLFQYAAGRNDAAISILMNEKYWPADRLPTRGDRKAQWLPMRDYGSDWEPADKPDHIHSGGDFLFCAGLVLGII